MTNRNEKVLCHINKDGYGIEIGPSFSPIAPKSEGYKVHVIDHMNHEQLINKYKDADVDLNNIEEVDFVWHGEKYTELTGKSKYYDWIIASHVIEHTPDLIGFLNECDTVLKDDGVLSLVIPDKRYCFDHFRPITGISKIIDNHVQQATIPTPGAVAESFLSDVKKAGNIAWNSGATGEYEIVHSAEVALQRMKDVLEESAYLDVHSWCFVPHSFRFIIHNLFSLGLIPFKEVDFFQTEGFEFYMTLGRSGQGVNLSRLEMLEIIEAESRDEVHISKTSPGGLLEKSKNVIKKLTA